jgi:hypothetical protein
MPNPSILYTRVERDYSTYTGRSSENLCRTVEALRKKERQGETQEPSKFMVL